MRFNWLQYLDLASELYAQAKSSRHSEANWRSSISRAYYATYHQSRHHLKDKWGISVAEASYAHQQVQQEFKQKNHNNIAYNLRCMRINRNIADYKDSHKDLETIAKENIWRAKQVLADLHHQIQESDVSYPNLENLYIFRGKERVISFLETYPFLIPLLQEAHIQIKKYFPYSDVALEVVTDPEIMGHKDLVAWIVVEQKADEAGEILDRFDEECGWNIMRRSEDKLCIMLEFR